MERSVLVTDSCHCESSPLEQSVKQMRFQGREKGFSWLLLSCSARVTRDSQERKRKDTVNFNKIYLAAAWRTIFGGRNK